MGRQAVTSKESELARSPSKSVKAPSPQGIPREPPSIPRWSSEGSSTNPCVGIWVLIL